MATRVCFIHLKTVESLLKSGVDPNQGNDDGVTPLHQCCIDNLKLAAELLLKYKAKVNIRDKELWTPLHVAATCGHVEIIKILIEKGADLLAVNVDGNMPYDICEQEESLTILETSMFQRGVTQDQIDSTRSTRENEMIKEIEAAVAANNNKLPKYLGPNGETLLHVSVSFGYLRLTEMLLRYRIKVNAADSDKWQAIHCATFWGQVYYLFVGDVFFEII
ncbi:hypothetical protein HELRODRAFT_80714 [Helobdella robusta]|uniref:Uncharacterized protein n=1 Tax=Helobdella robusta TaxID=6412 RepID=T1G442_HELRO|nr:hypothetical protein HELRODRAFT_80714 [Helobdella robusta]ESO03111.1 hypothetical protein HELRODRAFT_80714 [Helobdella robusta]